MRIKDSVQLGEVIKKIRLEKKLTMQQVARLADINVLSYSRVEKGSAGSRFSTVVLVLKSLNCSLSILED